MSIIARLYQVESLRDLLQSIASNGFMDIEPFVVLLEGEVLTVLEGNRRLAAILLFRNPSLAFDIRKNNRVRIALPDFPDRYRHTLDFVSVYRVSDRKEARSYLGFKHIKGPKKWHAYAKAKYAAMWYRKDKVCIEFIADAIGDRSSTVKRMINAVYVMEQAESTGIFSVADRSTVRFSFSHLYHALSRQPYREFLGFDGPWDTFVPNENPIAEEHLSKLQEMLHWIYGSKERGLDSVIRLPFSDIRHLAEVLGNGEALVELRTSGSLVKAHAKTKPPEERFAYALVAARDALHKAMINLRGYTGTAEALLPIAADILESAENVSQRMKEKQQKATGRYQ